ncbi:MAG TPA: sialidase family protein [Acidimicrobiales bacterium]|nr:sialidase family protein [Acidimicrobiales bacterium]
MASGLGLSLVLALLGSPARGEVTPGRVSENTRFQGDNNDPVRGRDIPGLAVDPNDPRHVVMIDEDFLAGQCDFHVTFDGGRTWDSGHLTAPPDFADPPCRTFDSGGYAHYNKSVVFGSGQNVYTTFASHRGEQQRPESRVVAGEGDSVIVNRSTDGGRTFERGVVAIQGGPGPWPFIIRPGVAVQPRPQGDKLYVVGWHVVNPPGMGASGGAGDRKAVVATSEDGGRTWSAPVEAQGPDEKVREIAPPVVGPDGAVYIAWRNRDDPQNTVATAPRPMVVAKSTDGGATWTRTPIGEVGPAPTTAPAPAGSSGYPRMAVDPRTGALYVVYVGFNFGDLDTILQRSTDGGTTWSPPLRVNDDPRGNGVRQLTPQVFVAPNGRVDVIWVDTRATYPSPIVPRPAGHGDVYYASSTDGGATFSGSRRISDRSMNLDEGLLARIGTYTWWGPAAAPMGNDAILFAWGDPRFGNVDTATNDIVLATMQLGRPGPAAITALPEASPANLSVAASQFAYPGGPERIGAAFSTKLVVVHKDDAAGAWAGAVLARAHASPLFVTDGTSLTKEQREEIGRLHPTGMFVIGDEGAIPQTLVDRMTRAGVITSLAPPPPSTTAPPTTVPVTAPPDPASVTTVATTAPAATTTTLAPTPTANRADVIRLSGATPAEVGRAVAVALDVRTDEEKRRSVPAFTGAVAVNPESDEAAAGLAFAASQRLPVLFVERDGVPAPTAEAFGTMAIQNTWVVGGPGSIGDTVLTQLPGAKRLGGADLAGTSAAVADEVKARGLPVNVAFVADGSRPVDAAVAAAAVARLGGILVLTPGGDAGAAEELIQRMGLSDQVDQVVVSRSTSPSDIPWVLIVVSAALAAAGLLLLLSAARKRQQTADAPPVPVPTAPERERRH